MKIDGVELKEGKRLLVKLPPVKRPWWAFWRPRLVPNGENGVYQASMGDRYPRI